MIIDYTTTIEDVIESFPDVHWSIKRLSIVKQMIESDTTYEIYIVNNTPYARRIKDE